MKGTASGNLEDPVDLTDSSSTTFNHIVRHVPQQDHPVALLIAQSTAHRKFLLEEINRISTLSFYDNDVVQQLHADLGEVSAQLGRMYKIQQSNSMKLLLPDGNIRDQNQPINSPPPKARGRRLIITTPSSSGTHVASSSQGSFEYTLNDVVQQVADNTGMNHTGYYDGYEEEENYNNDG